MINDESVWDVFKMWLRSACHPFELRTIEREIDSHLASIAVVKSWTRRRVIGGIRVDIELASFEMEDYNLVCEKELELSSRYKYRHYIDFRVHFCSAHHP